jgi:hypothetical protein
MVNHLKSESRSRGKFIWVIQFKPMQNFCIAFSWAWFYSLWQPEAW